MKSRLYRTGLGVVLVLGLWIPWGPLSAQTTGKHDAAVASIALSALALEDATVKVTVLEDPLRPVRTVLDMCASIDASRQRREDSEFTEHMRRLCQTIERFTQAIEPPVHALRPGGYVVTIPLRQPIDGIRAVLWRSASLDEAMVFLDLLSGGKLRGITVYRRLPPSSDEGSVCVDCPIKDLVFSAAGLKEDPRILE